MNKRLIFVFLFFAHENAFALDELFPISDEKNELDTVTATLDGKPFVAWYMPDMDADGKAELRFFLKQGTERTCHQIAIVPSSFQYGIDLNSAMLPDLIYWVHTIEPADSLEISSSTCLNEYPTAIGDINNDGLNDFFTRNGAVVFGSMTPGTVVDTGRADGSLATVFGKNSVPKSVGDIDGDGLNDFTVDNTFVYQKDAVVKGGLAFTDSFDIELVPDENIILSGALGAGAGDLNGDGIDDLILGGGKLVYGKPELKIE